MFDYRCGVRLAGTTADTAVLKLLRREFPDVPLTKHRRRILAGEPVYASGHEPSQLIDIARLASLLERLGEAGVEVLLTEEQLSDGQWEPLPPGQSEVRDLLPPRFRRLFGKPDGAEARETIVLVLDPGTLENPDLDLRCAVPEQVEAFTEGAVRDQGFSYLETPPGRPGPLMCLFLQTQSSAAGQWPRVLALLRERRFLDNDLSQSAELYLAPHPQAAPEDWVKVYPPA